MLSIVNNKKKRFLVRKYRCYKVKRILLKSIFYRGKAFGQVTDKLKKNILLRRLRKYPLIFNQQGLLPSGARSAVVRYYFRRRKIYKRRRFNVNPFKRLEQFSLFFILKRLRRLVKVRGKRQKVKLLKKLKQRRRRYYQRRYLIPYRRKRKRSKRKNLKLRYRKRLKNLVYKDKKWCVKIKKSDGRVIYRPLKLSDFLSRHSGWRTRTFSSRNKLRKSDKPKLAFRGLLRSRSEYDVFVLKKRKLYNYYRRIYKYIAWKFLCYRSVFKKYSISFLKYKSFTKIQCHFSWNVLSTNYQINSSNLKYRFRYSIRYMLAGNSKRLWKINQFLFVNACFPTTYHHSINDFDEYSNRVFLYNWNKAYRLFFIRAIRQNTFLTVVPKIAAFKYKNMIAFSYNSLRFLSLLSNSQRHFMR